MRKVFHLCAVLILWICGFGIVLQAQVSPEERKKIEEAIPKKASAKPQQPRKLLVLNLVRWGGKPQKGHASIPHGNLALELMGKTTGAYSIVVSDDLENLHPQNLNQFDAICFNNTAGAIFDDPELKKSLLGFIQGGKGFIGIHAAGATFAEWPRYDFWPEFGEMLGGYENGGHPWKANEPMTMSCVPASRRTGIVVARIPPSDSTLTLFPAPRPATSARASRMR